MTTPGNGTTTPSTAALLDALETMQDKASRVTEVVSAAGLGDPATLYHALLAVTDAAHFATRACLVWRKEGAPTR